MKKSFSFLCVLILAAGLVACEEEGPQGDHVLITNVIYDSTGASRIELYNPLEAGQDISEWQIKADDQGGVYTLPDSLLLLHEQTRLVHQASLPFDILEGAQVIRLMDENGETVDVWGE